MIFTDACDLEICQHDTSFTKWEAVHSTLYAYSVDTAKCFSPSLWSFICFLGSPTHDRDWSGPFLFVIIMLVPCKAEYQNCPEWWQYMQEKNWTYKLAYTNFTYLPYQVYMRFSFSETSPTKYCVLANGGFLNILKTRRKMAKGGKRREKAAKKFQIPNRRKRQFLTSPCWRSPAIHILLKISNILRGSYDSDCELKWIEVNSTHSKYDYFIN